MVLAASTPTNLQPANNTPGTACIAGGGTIAWNATSVLALSNASSKTARVYNVCGTIPFGQDAAAGAYTDTVIVCSDGLKTTMTGGACIHGNAPNGGSASCGGYFCWQGSEGRTIRQ